MIFQLCYLPLIVGPNLNGGNNSVIFLEFIVNFGIYLVFTGFLFNP